MNKEVVDVDDQFQWDDGDNWSDFETFVMRFEG
jgi:hypothetical protein